MTNSISYHTKLSLAFLIQTLRVWKHAFRAEYHREPTAQELLDFLQMIVDCAFMS